MIIDEYTKFILTIIAMALTLNAFNPWIAPTLLEADDKKSLYSDLRGVQGGLEYIADAIRNYPSAGAS